MMNMTRGVQNAKTRNARDHSRGRLRREYKREQQGPNVVLTWYDVEFDSHVGVLKRKDMLIAYGGVASLNIRMQSHATSIQSQQHIDCRRWIRLRFMSWFAMSFRERHRYRYLRAISLSPQLTSGMNVLQATFDSSRLGGDLSETTPGWLSLRVSSALEINRHAYSSKNHQYNHIALYHCPR